MGDCEETKEDVHDDGEMEQFVLKVLEDKHALLMLLLCNIVTLSHYQRFESENAALKWLGNMRMQPTLHLNHVLVSLSTRIIDEYKKLFPETAMHQIGHFVASLFSKNQIQDINA